MNSWDDDNKSVASVVSIGSKASLVSMASKKSFKAALDEFLPRQSQKSYEIVSMGALAHEELEGNRITNMVKRDVKMMRSIYSNDLPGSSKKLSSKKHPKISPLEQLLENVKKLPTLGNPGSNSGDQFSDIPVDIAAGSASKEPGKAKLDPMSASGKLFLPPNGIGQVSFTADGAIKDDTQSEPRGTRSKAEASGSGSKSVPRASNSLKAGHAPSAQVVSPVKGSKTALPEILSDKDKEREQEALKERREKEKRDRKENQKEREALQQRLKQRQLEKEQKRAITQSTKTQSRSRVDKENSKRALSGIKRPSVKGTSAKGKSPKKAPLSNNAQLNEVVEPTGDIPSFNSNLTSAPEVALWGSQKDVLDYHGSEGRNFGAEYCGDQFRFSSADEGHMWGGNHLEEQPVDHKHQFCFNVNSSTADEVHIWGAHADSEEADSVTEMSRRASRAASGSSGFMSRRVSGAAESMNIWAADHSALEMISRERTCADLFAENRGDDSGSIVTIVSRLEKGETDSSSYKQRRALSPRGTGKIDVDHGSAFHDWSDHGHGDMREHWMDEDDSDFLDSDHGEMQANFDQKCPKLAILKDFDDLGADVDALIAHSVENVGASMDELGTDMQVDSVDESAHTTHDPFSVSKEAVELASVQKVDANAVVKVQALFRGKSVRGRKLAQEPERTEEPVCIREPVVAPNESDEKAPKALNRKPPPVEPPADGSENAKDLMFAPSGVVVTLEPLGESADTASVSATEVTVDVNVDGRDTNTTLLDPLGALSDVDGTGVKDLASSDEGSVGPDSRAPRRRKLPATKAAKKKGPDKPYACKNPGCNKRYFLAFDLTVHEKCCEFITASIANSYKKSHRVPAKYQIADKNNWRRHLPEGFK